MWRIWTKGWGPRAWWHHFTTYQFPNFVVALLPRTIVYWAFIKVHAEPGTGPGPDFVNAAKAWTAETERRRNA